MSGVRKALEIGRVNLVRQLRDRGDLFFVLVLPTLIIVALGLQFGGSTAARLGVVVPAGDADAAALVELLRADDARLDVRPVGDEATLRSKVEHGELEAGLVIPDGFAAALRGDRDGRAALPGHDRRARPGPAGADRRGGRPGGRDRDRRARSPRPRASPTGTGRGPRPRPATAACPASR